MDFNAPKEPVYYDSTSGVIAACGMLEIAKLVPDGKYYAEEAIKILKAIEKNWCNYEDAEDGLVMMGSDRYPQNENELSAAHKNIIYGDFFFVEAMLKLKEIDFLIW